jgi:predicted nuclease of predicted toxin-antitoxin system
MSPDLATLLRERGFVCEHINDIKKKRRKKRVSDREVAAYALERDLIVLTRNLVDFEQIYVARQFHPGLILFDCPEEITFTVELQREMLLLALDGAGRVLGVVSSEPIQEAVVVSCEPDDELGLERILLPNI